MCRLGVVWCGVGVVSCRVVWCCVVLCVVVWCCVVLCGSVRHGQSFSRFMSRMVFKGPTVVGNFSNVSSVVCASICMAASCRACALCASVSACLCTSVSPSVYLCVSICVPLCLHVGVSLRMCLCLHPSLHVGAIVGARAERAAPPAAASA